MSQAITCPVCGGTNLVLGYGYGTSRCIDCLVASSERLAWLASMEALIERKAARNLG